MGSVSFPATIFPTRGSFCSPVNGTAELALYRGILLALPVPINGLSLSISQFLRGLRGAQLTYPAEPRRVVPTMAQVAVAGMKVRFRPRSRAE